MTYTATIPDDILECKGCCYVKLKSEWKCDFTRLKQASNCPCSICLIKAMCNNKSGCELRKKYRRKVCKNDPEGYLKLYPKYPDNNEGVF